MIDLGDELADYDGKSEGPPPQEMRGYAHGMQSAGRLADLQAQGFNKEPPSDMLPPLAPWSAALYANGGNGGIPGVDDRPPWPDGGSAAPWVPDPLPPWILVTENAGGSLTYRDTRHDDQGS